ncbi:MAG TPA: CDP-diacylglycerol--glycerol-3-phosphate 3-phosphatidyltransferase [Desulfobacteraceae bacterium]|nr:MAG: CDP-diacylglycerol--glycerol-3-phosphate 3-phosphatidyltransferase [Deltaproteobacteria bacterium]HDZ23617.1 CDP-diacylglycerol--glycerol-3-phosphate 3-phosphatidyltransferase [Desulfobacteraceae bacterium]
MAGKTENRAKGKASFREEVFNLPNSLTFFRIACIPLVLLFLKISGKTGSFLAALLLALAFITDMLDGYLARRYASVTTLGKFLDPLADKILVSVSMIMLIPLGRIPVWMVIVIIAREMAVTGLRGIAVSEGIVIQASSWGKYKTVFQCISLVGLCLHFTYLRINFHMVGMIFLWIALALTVWSGWDYFSQFSRKVFVK